MAMLPLDTSGAVQFFGTLPDTYARVYLGPQVARQTWKVKRVVVSSTSSETKQPRFFLYKNHETPSTLLDSTYSGNGATTETDIEIRPGERLLGVWVGGTPGAYATMIVNGEMT